MVGETVTKADVNRKVGDVASDWNDVNLRIEKLRHWLVAKVDQDLFDLGFNQGEVDTLRSAVGQMGQAIDLIFGRTTLGTATDLTVFPSRVWGFGGDL